MLTRHLLYVEYWKSRTCKTRRETLNLRNHQNFVQRIEKRRRRQRRVREHNHKQTRRPINIKSVSKRQPGEGLLYLSPRAMFALWLRYMPVSMEIFALFLCWLLHWMHASYIYWNRWEINSTERKAWSMSLITEQEMFVKVCCKGSVALIAWGGDYSRSWRLRRPRMEPFRLALYLRPGKC